MKIDVRMCLCYYCTERIRWTHALNLCPVTHHRCIYTGESSQIYALSLCPVTQCFGGSHGRSSRLLRKFGPGPKIHSHATELIQSDSAASRGIRARHTPCMTPPSSGQAQQPRCQVGPGPASSNGLGPGAQTQCLKY
jgi:hypothetical protein